MTDQADDTDKRTELLKLIEQLMREGRLRSFYDPALRDLIMFKPGHTVANPEDKRRN